MYWNNLKKTEGLTGSIYLYIKKKGWGSLSAFFIFSLISGCATTPFPRVEITQVDRFPAYEMADGSKIYPGSVEEAIPDVDILAIDDDITSYLDERVKTIKNPRKRLEMLTKILVHKVLYDTLDDTYGAKTAQETFDSGTGNCLSFTNLFVAMTRYVGLKSVFSEIPTLPNWIREGEILFFTRHIGASVDIYKSFDQVIQLEISGQSTRMMTMSSNTRYYFTPSELAPEDYRVTTFGFTSIPDGRAFAQYYNNLGSRQLADGNAPQAFRYFIKAIKTWPRLSFAWSNLGVVYRRNGQIDAAKAAYLQGLAVTQGSRDTSALTIMNNLANLYEITGDREKAAFYKTQVASFREKNPYYQYAAGKTAYKNALFEKSVGLFKKAIRLKDDEHLFYYGLALAYLKTGEIGKAELNISRAIDHSWDRKSKDYYEKFLDAIKIKDIN